MICVLCGGVGAAKFLRGLIQVVDPSEVIAIINTGDDFRLHGLAISPDIDTIRYTLSNDVGEHGWGRANDTWTAMAALDAIATAASSLNPSATRANGWFRLGDRDIATHLYRSQRLSEGASLSQVTQELTASSGLQIKLVPMSDDIVSTQVLVSTQNYKEFMQSQHGDVANSTIAAAARSNQTTSATPSDVSSANTQTAPDSTWIDFQTYFVGLQHSVPIQAVRFSGIEDAAPSIAALDAVYNAEQIIIAPSNPFVSIAPILALQELGDAVAARREQVVAISPIVNKRAIKGPAAEMLKMLGHSQSAAGVASIWHRYASTLFIDHNDIAETADIEATGMKAIATDTVMRDVFSAATLARCVISKADSSQTLTPQQRPNAARAPQRDSEQPDSRQPANQQTDSEQPRQHTTRGIGRMSFIAVEGIAEVDEDTDLAGEIAHNARLQDLDVVVVSSKIVAKAEGQLIRSHRSDTDLYESVVANESVRILRKRGALTISETRHGFVCANAGVDRSNVPPHHVVMLPVDPDRSANKLRNALKGRFGVNVGVVISDTFGRAWRNGVVDVALGIAGISPMLDLRGNLDDFGNTLDSTVTCIADEIAAGAELAMGKARRTPVVIARGLTSEYFGEGSIAKQVVRKSGEDMFR